jgi:TM2 domain-containing membrane protein YozV
MSSPPTAPTKYCHACGEVIDSRAEICPKCGVRQPGMAPYGGSSGYDPELRDAASKKIAAGLCGILVGALGVHKFVLGMTMPGVIMLVISVATCGFGAVPMGILGLVEGIIYLTKSDEEFYQTYIVEKKEWL